MAKNRSFQGAFLAAITATTALSAPAAHADDNWRSQNTVFRIGVAEDSSAPRAAGQYERFRQVIEKAINMPVDIFVAANLASLIDAHASGRVDYAPLTLLGYYTADRICDCSEPLVAPTSAQGATAIRSVLLVKPDRVTGIDDLTGKPIAIGPAISVTGALIPMVQFQFNGKPLAQSGLTLTRTDSFDETLALLAGDDVGAAFGWTYADDDSARLFDDGLASRAKQVYGLTLETLWRSDSVPLNPHVVARQVPDEIKRSLRAAMLSLHADHPLAFDEISPTLSGPMRSVTAFDYRSAIELIDKARP